MIESLISSKTRIKLLLKFFLNSSNVAYLRGLESEFSESSNAIRVELNKLESAGLLSSYAKGNKKLFHANKKHPLFEDIHHILLKYTGLDGLVDRLVEKLGDLEEVHLVGQLARGLHSDVIDLIFVGDIKKDVLFALVEKVQGNIKNKIKYTAYTAQEVISKKVWQNQEYSLLLWSK